MIKIVAAEVAIPIESRKMVNPSILSKVLAKQSTIMPMAAKAVKLTVNTSFLSSFFLNDAGSIPSSLMAYMTLGLLKSNTLTYANTATNNNTDETMRPVGPNIFSATIEAMPLEV